MKAARGYAALQPSPACRFVLGDGVRENLRERLSQQAAFTEEHGYADEHRIDQKAAFSSGNEAEMEGASAGELSTSDPSSSNKPNGVGVASASEPSNIDHSIVQPHGRARRTDQGTRQLRPVRRPSKKVALLC